MCRHDNSTARVAAALLAAERRPGWNNRSGRIERFTLGNCRLIVVPCKRWAYRRQELRGLLESEQRDRVKRG